MGNDSSIGVLGHFRHFGQSTPRDALVSMYKVNAAVTAALFAIAILCTVLVAMYSIPVVVWTLAPIAIIGGLGSTFLGIRTYYLAKQIGALSQNPAVDGFASNLARDSHDRAEQSQTEGLHRDSSEHDEGQSAWSRFKGRITFSSSKSSAEDATSSTATGASRPQSPVDSSEHDEGQSAWSRFKGRITFSSSKSSAEDATSSTATGASRPQSPVGDQAESGSRKSGLKRSFATFFASLRGAKPSADPILSRLRNSARYYNELELKPIPEKGMNLLFTQDYLKALKRQTDGPGGSLNLPYFIRSHKTQQNYLFVDTDVFFLKCHPILPESQRDPDELPPFFLGVHSQFLQGVRVHEAVLPITTPENFDLPVEFFKGLRYNVTYEKLLDRSIVMETMLGLHMH
ncbi:MAG: hypothetical protein ACTJLL_02455, partial [Anaplasma sp.]